MRRASLLLLAAAVVAPAAGCAGPATRLRHDNARLAAENDRLRAELRRERRGRRDLETENLVLRDQAGVGARRARPVPELPVEVLGPAAGARRPAAGGDAWDDDERVVGVTEDGTEIVYVGDAARGRGVAAPDDLDLGGDGDDLAYAPDDDDVVPRPARAPAPAKPAGGKPPGKPSGAGKGDAVTAAYEAAVAKVRAKDHDGAIAALRAFVAAHPRHDLADNAQYWIGEVYYDARDYARAIVEFRATIDAYPRGNKVPDALLKLGYCFAALGQKEKARAALEQVVQVYPRTPPAELAARKLGELK